MDSAIACTVRRPALSASSTWTLPRQPVLDVTREQRDRLIDRRAVGRQQAGRCQRTDPLERRQVLGEIPAAASNESSRCRRQ